MVLVLDREWNGDGFTIVEQTRAGVSRAKADEIAQSLGLTDKEMARILNLSKRTLHQLRPDARLDSNASERLLLLEMLIRHGLDVFDGRADVLGRWLHGPLPELRQQAPRVNHKVIAPWLAKPDVLTVGVPSAVVPDSYNYLVHPGHASYEQITIARISAFPIDARLW